MRAAVTADSPAGSTPREPWMPEATELDAAVAAELARRRRFGQDPDATLLFGLGDGDAGASHGPDYAGDGRMWAAVAMGPSCGHGACCPFEGTVFTLDELPALPRHEGCECRYVALAHEPAASPD